jgi:valyl-tRNA synthetase
MDKRVDYNTIESKWQKYWLDNNVYHSEINKNKNPYVIVQPPPNITAKLHFGHTVNNTFIDIMARYKRLCNYNVCIIPGVDHAGIATQSKVEQNLKLQKIKKEDLGREKFMEIMWNWKNEHQQIITNQIKKLGCSYDWQRENFTMSHKFSNHVKDLFCSLYDQKLIYRGNYMINWCPVLQTAISDIEVDSKDIKAKLYNIKYKLDNSDEYLIVATTRPETIFGDVAVCFNPNDERYKKYSGMSLIIPIINKKISLITDEYVDMNFGTGLLKITPAHDCNDYELGKKHNLPCIKVINESGKICNTNTHYDGMSREKCREEVVKKLNDLKLMDSITSYNSTVKICSRSGAIVEQMITKQWFVRMQPLVELAKKMIEKKEVVLLPEKNTKLFDFWTNNIRDWCISRQLWWGHQIPVFYCNKCGNEECSKDILNICKKCGEKVEQDSDVLDTWFSSALWAFGVFDNDEELNYYYPTNTLITGDDILFFWVIKMMVMSGFKHNKVPFTKVFLHGLVRDKFNVKMTKTLGNVVDPLDLIEKYGTDPLRFSICYNFPKEHDFKFDIKQLDIGKTFCTKYWNIIRYCLDKLESKNIVENYDFKNIDENHRKILEELGEVTNKVKILLDNFDFQTALRDIYHFVWDLFANDYLEKIKGNINNNQIQNIVFKILKTITILLNPFIPHLTEEIWQLMCDKLKIKHELLHFQEYR